MSKSIRKPYSTSLNPDVIKKIKLLAIDKNTSDNRIIEIAILHYINHAKDNDIIYTVFPNDTTKMPQGFPTFEEANDYGNEQFGTYNFTIGCTGGECI